MKKWHKTVLTACITAATAITPIATIIPAAQAQAQTTATINMYVAPQGKCNNNNIGTSSTQAVCDLKTANTKLLTLQNSGKARGDVYIRFYPGIYKGMSSARGTAISFSPSKGKTLYIVPTWFKSETTATRAPRKDYPVIDGSTGTGEAKHNGIAISPARNFGGKYYVGFLDIKNVNNGIRFAGGYNFRPNPQDRMSTTAKDINKGAIRTGNKAPIKGLTIAHNYISRTGNTYGTTGTKDKPQDGYGPVQIQNTVGAIVKNNVMTDVKRTKGDDPHAIYGYLSPDMRIEGNTFTNTTPTPLRYRMGGNWIVKNNTFNNTGMIGRGVLSVYTNNTNTDAQLPECASQNGQSSYFGSNKINNGLLSFLYRLPFDTGGSGALYQAAANCKIQGRIAAPEITNTVKSGTGHKVTWNAPDNSRVMEVKKNSQQDIVRYHIYTGKDNTKGDTYGYGKKIATVPATRREHVIPDTAVDGSQYVYIVAESRGGGFSPVLGNKTWMQ